MLRYAIVENGVVTNTEMGPEGYENPTEGATTIQTNTANIGWTYANGTFTPPAPVAPTPAELVADINAAAASILAKGQTWNVAASGQPAVGVLCDGMSTTIGVLAAFMLFGMTAPSGSTATKGFEDNNGFVTQLSPAEAMSLANQVGNWSDNVRVAAAGLRNEATATPPTLTTEAQLAGFAWPTS